MIPDSKYSRSGRPATPCGESLRSCNVLTNTIGTMQLHNAETLMTIYTLYKDMMTGDAPWVRFVTLLLGAFLFCLHSAVLQVSKSPRITLGA